MQKRVSFILLVCFLSSAVCAQPEPHLASFAELKNSFAAPSRHFGSAPLWVWNTDVDSADIHYMLRQFKANAFGGVFIHPRPGLITPYLSKQWLNLYSYTVQQAKEIGLDVWIYDEDSYPSGFAGGLVPDLMPSSYDQGQMLESIKMDRFPEDPSLYFICLKKNGSQYVDITATAAEEKGKTGDYIVFKKRFYYSSPWYGGFSYVDLMVKGVTEKFLELTMDPYKKTIGNEFGKTVRGVFSDEPNIETQYGHCVRWTPDLFKTFRATWGYDLEVNMPSLLEETGDWQRIRHNYHQTMLQLFIDRWSKPYAKYTADNNLEWTGHYWEHAWPNPDQGPDNMAMYAYPQRPGIDMLFNQFNENDVNAQFGNIRSVKELSSVANQLDKKRTLSETYGGGGWELTFNDMKRLGDWEFALGVNTLNQHLSFMSMAGARKYDYPQSFSYQTPWWPLYKNLNQYFARLSLALSAGEQHNDILVIEPTTTAWMHVSIDNPDSIYRILGNQFQHFITTLEHAQAEYDLGSENIILNHGRTEGANFIVGSRKYKMVVLPPGLTNLDNKTFQLLKAYAAAGGKILTYSPLTTIDGGTNKQLDEFNRAGYSGIIHQDSLLPENIATYFSDADFRIQKNAGGDLYHYRRKLKDASLAFFSNASITEHATGSFSAPGKEILLMDLSSGQIYLYPSSKGASGLSANFDIPPSGSMLFVVLPLASTGYKNYIPLNLQGKQLSAPTEVIRKTDNSLTIDFCDLKIGDTLAKDMHVFDAADYVFKHHGFPDGNPWNTSVQFKDHTIRRDSFSKSSGYTATYNFTIASDVMSKNMKAVVENPQLYTVRVNGTAVRPVAGKWWLDKAFKIFSIGELVHSGMNTLSVTASPMNVHDEVEPVYILGDFNLRAAGKGWEIVKPGKLELGSWKAQGLPMFGQAISYCKKINLIGSSIPHLLVRLDQWKGTVASVQVNGQTAGLISIEPYALDISPLLKSGENNIEVTVIGSLKNVVGPFHGKPAPGMVGPGHFRNVKAYISGTDYDLYDYGLLDDFKIIQQ